MVRIVHVVCVVVGLHSLVAVCKAARFVQYLVARQTVLANKPGRLVADSNDARLFASESGVVAANIGGCIRCAGTRELFASAHVCEVIELILIVLVVTAAVVLSWLHIVGLPNASTSSVILRQLVSGIAVH